MAFADGYGRFTFFILIFGSLSRSDKIVRKVQLSVALAREGLCISKSPVELTLMSGGWTQGKSSSLIYFVSLLIWQARISYLKLVDENFENVLSKY